MNAADLIAFEADIAAEFNAGKIRAPVHLYDGCEEQMIDVFKHVAPADWVCCSWRSHYQCLLKGVPAAELKAEIMSGRSISLCFPKHRIVSSAIVGGIIPIALGIAMAIKRENRPEKVFCFVGEMTAETGIAWECFKYSCGHGLPITFVVEDNGLSVCTNTREVWMTAKNGALLPEMFMSPHVLRYAYKSKFPHAGAGKRVEF